MRNKNQILVFLLCFLISSVSLKAQKLTIGTKGGLNVSTLGKKDNGLEARLGYHGGLFANFDIIEEFQFQTEILVSLQGARDENINEIRNKYLYLNLPILAKFQIDDSFGLMLGPQVSYLLSAKIKDPIMDEDIRDNLRNVDIGAAGGIQYQSPHFFDIGIRFIWGILSTTRDAANTEAKFRNKVLQATIQIPLIKTK